jgi:flagella basal body P-ring formation protein FlgA
MNVRGSRHDKELAERHGRSRGRLPFLLLAVLAAVAGSLAGARGEDRMAGLTVLDLVRDTPPPPARRFRQRLIRVPVPAVTVYPGQVITADMLRFRRYRREEVDGRYITDADALLGRMAARTLVRNRPVPPSSVTAPWVVRRGKAVRLVFRAAGLEITALGTALDNAAAGEIVAVRNVDSGRVVYGVAGENGTVRVGTR